jgi:hypothetical protein
MPAAAAMQTILPKRDAGGRSSPYASARVSTPGAHLHRLQTGSAQLRVASVMLDNTGLVSAENHKDDQVASGVGPCVAGPHGFGRLHEQVG